MEPGRPYHHGNLREALLEQAMLTLRERGVEALSLRELAREVGVSHAAPRRHFPDRQALLDALAVEGFARLNAELRAAAVDDQAPFEMALLRSAQAYVAFATRDGALLEVMFAAKHTETVDGAADEAFAPVLELILRGQAERAFEPGDPERVGLLLLSTIHGIAALRTAGVIEPEQVDWLTDDAIANLLRGSRRLVAGSVDGG